MPRATRKTTAAEKASLQANLTSYWNQYKKNHLFWLVVLVIGLGLLFWYKKGWFIAATVNGQPISNLELQQKLNSQFRSQTLSQIIDEVVIKQAAQKKGVTVSPAEVDQKISQLEQNFGGAQTLDSLLSQQGLTRNGLRDQLSVQLMLEKLYKDEATVSAEEISKFLAENKDQLRATDSAAQEVEAKEALTQQKLSQIFRQKFQELKSAAKINIF